MKHIGMKYQSIDACPQDHVIYHKEHKNTIKCLEFNMSRYQDDQVTKKGVSQASSLHPHYSTS